MSELLQKYPNQPNFLLYSAVNNGFLASANARTNVEWRALQGPGIQDHYTIPMSPSGKLPANFWGASGLVRAKEMDRIIDYYLTIQRNDVDAWACIPVADGSGLRIWSKSDGWEAGPKGPYTFEEFLDTTNPPKQIIVGDPDKSAADYLNFYAIAEDSDRTWANNKIENFTDDGWDHLLTGFSSSGSAPATEYACLTMKLPTERPGLGPTLDDIKMQLPPGSINKVRAFVSRGEDDLMIWNNDDGDVPPQPLPWDGTTNLGDVDGVEWIPGQPTPPP